VAGDLCLANAVAEKLQAGLPDAERSYIDRLGEVGKIGIVILN
jgi:hypothetical protein